MNDRIQKLLANVYAHARRTQQDRARYRDVLHARAQMSVERTRPAVVARKWTGEGIALGMAAALFGIIVARVLVAVADWGMAW